ncbi:alpha/beta fold hydrolase [Novosphingobium sp. BL-52-GroH]|uniref:alpha/beta fold hydrolase n=1 Tax=Novosphingobium sp. BL-52-GroH TaxID=3349877 RepID=UPI00384FE7FC
MSAAFIDPVDRAFVRIEEGQVHLRRCDGAKAVRPLVMVHASPGSSRGLAPLMREMTALDGAPTLIAPDTLGNGDSVAPTVAEPDIAWFARSLVRVLDALGLDKVDLYGTHTGARTVCEMAAAFPDRVGRVVFDGIGDYTPEMRDLLVDRYAPEMAPDDYGTQFVWAFHFVRDQALHFPHFLRDPAHRLTARPVPEAADLHTAVVDVLKGLGSYHKPYRAAFRYEAGKRLGDIAAPVLFVGAENELPSLRAATEGLCALCRDGRVVPVSGDPRHKARAILDFLQAGTSDAD